MTTTTISDEQYRHVCDWRARIGEVGPRIEVLRADYRELAGVFFNEPWSEPARGTRAAVATESAA